MTTPPSSKPSQDRGVFDDELPSSPRSNTPWYRAPEWFVLVVLVVVIGIVLLVRSLRTRDQHSGLPTLTTVPEFTLTDQDAKPFGSDQLKGRVVIVEFFFTSCTTVCPGMTQRLVSLQPQLAKYGDAVHTLSISVDAIGDTPERLKTYAIKYKINESHWTLVRANDDHETETICTQFAQGVEIPNRRADGTVDPVALAHVSRLGLLDKHRRLRGMYTLNDEGIAALTADVDKLVHEP